MLFCILRLVLVERMPPPAAAPIQGYVIASDVSIRKYLDTGSANSGRRLVPFAWHPLPG
jgi:hypothetical protein